MAAAPVGFIGLGNMGSVLAANLVHSGRPVMAYDLLGPERAPAGSEFVESVAELARRVEIAVLSLPDGAVLESVAREILAIEDRRIRFVVDTSTSGVGATQVVAALLDDGGIALVSAPVSGGPAGARARTLAVMYAGTDAACDAVGGVLKGLSDRLHRVGDAPAMAQGMKLLNNFLSATALAATSEAIAFGESLGLDMGTMLEVLNSASGQSKATSDKFPNHVLTERYASGFSNSLMSKDVQLYLSAVAERGGASAIGQVTASIWERFADAEPGVDFTRIFPFVERNPTD